MKASSLIFACIAALFLAACGSKDCGCKSQAKADQEQPAQADQKES